MQQQTTTMAPTGEPPPPPTPVGGPTRRCLISGVTAPKSALIRCVVAPDGDVVPDIAGRLPGRGLWLQCRRDIIAKACTKNVFARAARCQVRPAASLADLVEHQLARRCIELIGLARRAGVIISGFDDVRDWLRRHAGADEAGVVIAAQDGALDGITKIAALARAVAPGMARRTALTAQELGQALGRERAVHIVIRPGPLADRFINEAGRLAGVRPDVGGAAGTGERSENGK
ncbi:MAG: RNA-binding protein [Alphaproteobacteria bacterium]